MRLIKTLTAEGTSLGEKTTKGGFWLIGTQATTRAFDFVRTIVLARILLPTDFGVFGIVLLVTSIVETFTETGFAHAIIQKKDDNSDEFLNTAWTATVIKALAVSLVLFVLSYFAVLFFGEPTAGPMIRVLSVYVIINGLANIKTVFLQKQMRFHKLFKYKVIGTIVQTIASIVLAIILRNAWAMVIGLILGAIANAIASYVIIPHTPRLTIVKEKIKYLWNYGKWLTGSSILSFLITDADDIFVGKLLGTETLGLYQVSYRISNLPSAELSRIVSGVAFPAYASIQDKIDKLQKAFGKVYEAISFSSIFIGAAIAVLAGSFTLLFLGENWVSIVPVIQLLVVSGVTRSFASATGSIFLATGRTKDMAAMQVIQIVIMYALIVPLTLNYGIVGTSLAVAFSAFALFFIRTMYCVKILGLKSRFVFSPLATSFGTVVAPVAGVLIIKSLLAFSPLPQFLIEATAFGALFLISALIVSKLSKHSPLAIIKNLKSNLFGQSAHENR